MIREVKRDDVPECVDIWWKNITYRIIDIRGNR